MFFLWKKYIHPPPIRIHPPYLYISIIKSVHYELELKIKFWVIVCKFCIYWYGQVLRSLSFADVPIIIQCNLWGKKYCVLLRYIIIFDKSRSFLLVKNIHCFCCCWYIRSFDLFLQYHCPSSSQVWSTSFSRQGESYVGDITTPPKQKPLTTTTIQRDCKTSLSEWFMTTNRPAFLHVVHSYYHYQWAR